MMKMKKTLLIAGAAGLAAITALAGFAMADMDGGGHGRGHDRGRHWQGVFERYDANKDGKVTQEEIDNNRQAWYAEFDIDKDGKLSIVEFEKLWLKARHRMMVREFQFFDTDGDGNVTILEYKGPLEDLVVERDRNNDGALSRADRPRKDDDDKGKKKWRERVNKQMNNQDDDEKSDDQQESDDNN
jgi:Ca2+-binding EF-hand superfamily protein